MLGYDIQPEGFMSRFSWPFLLLIGWMNFTPLSSAWATEPVVAGMVTHVSGNASLEENGTNVPLQTGQIINVGDILLTGKNSRLEFRLEDGSRFSLAPATRFRIKEYDYDATNSRPGTGFFDLVSGALRGVTGALTLHPAHRFEVHTAVATIGIRGTEFTAELSDSDLNVAMIEGKGVFVRNSKGRQIELDQPLLGTHVAFHRNIFNRLSIEAPEEAHRLQEQEIKHLDEHMGWQQRPVKEPHTVKDPPEEVKKRREEAPVKSESAEELTPEKKPSHRHPTRRRE
jgi:hypothetical protein